MPRPHRKSAGPWSSHGWHSNRLTTDVRLQPSRLKLRQESSLPSSSNSRSLTSIHGRLLTWPPTMLSSTPSLPPSFPPCPLIPAQASFEAALAHMVREDPSLVVQVDEESGQTVLKGIGELHLEVWSVLTNLRRVRVRDKKVERCPVRLSIIETGLLLWVPNTPGSSATAVVACNLSCPGRPTAVCRSASPLQSRNLLAVETRGLRSFGPPPSLPPSLPVFLASSWCAGRTRVVYRSGERSPPRSMKSGYFFSFLVLSRLRATDYEESSVWRSKRVKRTWPTGRAFLNRRRCEWRGCGVT